MEVTKAEISSSVSPCQSMAPCISVVIPTFNTSRESLLRSITSVLTQNYNSLELIVVDDGSDIPFAGLEKTVTNERITWIALDENRGVAAARNIGIGRARGEYVAFLDAGDWWEESKLEKQICLFHACDVGWVYCGAVGHTPEGIEIVNRPAFKGNIYRPLLKDQIVTGSCSAVMVKTSLLEEVGSFYEHEDLHEDWDLWIRLAKVAQVDYVPKPLVHLRLYEHTSRSKQLVGYAQRKATFLRRYNKELKREGLLTHAWARHYLIMGRKYLFQGQPLMAFFYWAKLIRLNIRMFPFLLTPFLLLSVFYRPLFRKITMWKLKRQQ